MTDVSRGSHRVIATDPRAKGLETGCGGLTLHEEDVGDRCHSITPLCSTDQVDRSTWSQMSMAPSCYFQFIINWLLSTYHITSLFYSVSLICAVPSVNTKDVYISLAPYPVVTSRISNYMLHLAQM